MASYLMFKHQIEPMWGNFVKCTQRLINAQWTGVEELEQNTRNTPSLKVNIYKGLVVDFQKIIGKHYLQDVMKEQRCIFVRNHVDFSNAIIKFCKSKDEPPSKDQKTGKDKLKPPNKQKELQGNKKNDENKFSAKSSGTSKRKGQEQPKKLKSEMNTQLVAFPAAVIEQLTKKANKPGRSDGEIEQFHMKLSIAFGVKQINEILIGGVPIFDNMPSLETEKIMKSMVQSSLNYKEFFYLIQCNNVFVFHDMMKLATDLMLAVIGEDVPTAQTWRYFLEYAHQRILARRRKIQIITDNKTKKPFNWINVVAARREKASSANATLKPGFACSCGSCWAFATSALVESLAAKSGRGLNSYAEQQLVDCIEGGCDGGNMEHALGYAQDHGLPFESDYPYHESRGQCHDAPIRIKLTQMTGIDHNEDNMAWSCKDGGPFVVSFKVGNSLMHYSGGILSNTDCDNDNAWHAVAVIGFGTDNGNRYWLAKNQWGTGWGESGYFRVRRGSNWCMWASDPLGGWV